GCRPSPPSPPGRGEEGGASPGRCGGAERGRPVEPARLLVPLAGGRRAVLRRAEASGLLLVRGPPRARRAAGERRAARRGGVSGHMPRLTFNHAKFWTQTRTEKLLVFVGEGLCDATIAARLGCTQAAVDRRLARLRAAGVEVPARGHFLTR